MRRFILISESKFRIFASPPIHFLEITIRVEKFSGKEPPLLQFLISPVNLTKMSGKIIIQNVTPQFNMSFIIDSMKKKAGRFLVRRSFAWLVIALTTSEYDHRK